MRNLKKILALVLALMMVLSVMVFASAANYDDYSDKDQVSPEYAEAVEVLTGMDIFWGSENSFYPKSNVSRAEVATLLYRVMTTDVSGSQVGIYKDYGMFDDVLETNWFAGYVNYAANGELVKGVGDNKYNPQGNVTGYEWITMLLRAIGYDANGEISGSTWKITAASQAKESGILGSFNEATLNSALTREQVAYLLFNAIQARKVNYTNAFGYQPSRLGYTIAWDMFRLAKTGTISIDAWGRPGYVWYGESSSTATPNTANYNSTVDTKYAAIEEAYTVHYTTAVTECDVADDTTDRDTNYALYVNGQSLGNYTVNAADTVTKIGAQGRLTEVYSDRIVMVDTFLARVTAVAPATYDTNDHLVTPATITLTVYDAINGITAGYVLTNGATNWNYTVGQMVLLNAYTDPTNSATVSGKVDNTNTGKYGKIYGVAESLVGAQSTIWWNAEQHTVNGTDYYDAVKFYLDVAGNSTIRFNWWLDQYGNLIGVTDIDRNSYVVLKDLTWIQGRPGYAEATLINMDGTEYTAVVDSIDGDASYTATATSGFGWDSDDFEPELEDAANIGFRFNSANVSTDTRYNGLYEGYALYYVTTNDDGSVNLDGYDDNGTPNNFSDNTYWVDYADNATLDTTASAILDDNDSDGAVDDVEVHVDDSTHFIVRSGSAATGYTYTAYTGTNNLPEFVPGTVEVFYNGVSTNAGTRIADYVYIKDYSLEADTGDHLFVTTDNYSQIAGSNVYVMSVVVEGTSRDIATTLANVQTLAANKGKLFHVDIATNLVGGYPYVTSIDLVNEATDAERGCNYLSQATTVGTNVLLCNGTSYHIDQAAVFSSVPGIDDYTDITQAVANTYGIWVISETNPYNVATYVYVGEKLSDSVAASVSIVVDGTKYPATLDTDTNTYEVVLPEDVTVDADDYWEITATGDANAKADNSVYTFATCQTAGTEFISLSNVEQLLANNTVATVYAENGVSHQYRLNYETTDENIAGMIIEITPVGGSATTQIATNQTGYKSLAAAVTNLEVLDVRNASVINLNENDPLVCPAVNSNNGQYAVKVVTFTNSAEATETNFGVRITEDPAGTTCLDGNVAVSSLIPGNVVVVRYAQQGTGIYFYYAFEVTNNNNQ